MGGKAITTQQQQLAQHLRAQLAWIRHNGGDFSGYVTKFGPERGAAIYNADMAELHRLEREAA